MTPEEQATLDLANSLGEVIEANSINRFERAASIAVTLACARTESERTTRRKAWEAEQISSIAST